MVRLPTKEEQKKFYQAQVEELEKVNLQNEFTRLRNEARLAIAKEENDEDAETAVKQELKKVEREFKTAELYIKVAEEQLAKL